MYFYVLTSVPQCPAPLSGLLWLSSLALRVLLSSAWLLLGPGESLFSTPFLASPLIGTTSGWRDQRTPQKPHAPEWKQRNIRIRGWKWQNMTMFTDANSQSLGLIFNTMFLLSAFGKKLNFKISSRWAGHSYLYPLLMVIFKAAIKVSRQLGGVDDLRQAL